VFEQQLTGDVQGPLQVTGAVEINGTLSGGAVVTGRLDMKGTVHGSIEVRLDGRADINAIVHGDVHARGGTLRIAGIIEGRLGVKEGADVLVAAGTVLNGRQLQADGTFTELSGQGSFRIEDDAPMMRPQPQGNWALAD
jgi:cytoskeletal protein CcmA (bactofilin family)